MKLKSIITGDQEHLITQFINDAVYQVVASQGVIKDYTLTLESETRGERFSIKQLEAGQLRRITKPTGYIKC